MSSNHVGQAGDCLSLESQLRLVEISGLDNTGGSTRLSHKSINDGHMSRSARSGPWQLHMPHRHRSLPWPKPWVVRHLFGWSRRAGHHPATHFHLADLDPQISTKESRERYLAILKGETAPSRSATQIRHRRHQLGRSGQEDVYYMLGCCTSGLTSWEQPISLGGRPDSKAKEKRRQRRVTFAGSVSTDRYWPLLKPHAAIGQLPYPKWMKCKARGRELLSCIELESRCDRSVGLLISRE
ncbi:hypothetical protein B0T24DRAFT_40210 [Lasiosphaeria ovina]|uniref:Uncharacterized protein n=1 Tax=Lasiosphaeria ovina TaxID=92902 RepID=A0AAE0NKU1_9PEZI|nr:hypothetical protein B0T24DRAFT_40210 [Lasiosphaeria ovina]